MIEIYFIVAVIAVQLGVFIATLVKAHSLRSSIPTGIDSYELYEQDTEGEVSSDAVSIVLRRGKAKERFGKILFEINHYLKKNSGRVTDVNHIKEISNRHLSKHESEVRSLVPIPLYLGLLGTISGVVIGLFGIPSLSVDIDTETMEAGLAVSEQVMKQIRSDSDALSKGVEKLIEGVKYAMIASFTGLAFTTVGAGWTLRRLRLRIDEGSNDLIAFIQAELLPVVSKDLVSSFNDLHYRLSSFTKSFSDSIEELKFVTWENSKSIDEQRKTFEAIDKLDIAQIAKFNVEVFKKLKGTVTSLDGFNESVQGIADVIGFTNVMAKRFELIANRTENFEKIAADVSRNLEVQAALMNFLQGHFSELERRKTLIESTVGRVDKSLEDSLVAIEDKVKTAQKEYSNQSEKHIDFLRAVTIAEEEYLREEKRRLQEALDNNQNRLGKLDYLEGINQGLSEQVRESQRMNKRMVDLLESLEMNIAKNTSEVRTIKKSSLIYQLQVLFWKIQGKITGRK